MQALGGTLGERGGARAGGRLRHRAALQRPDGRDAAGRGQCRPDDRRGRPPVRGRPRTIWRAIARRSARQGWPMPAGGSPRCSRNGDKAGPNPVAAGAPAGLHRTLHERRLPRSARRRLPPTRFAERARRDRAGRGRADRQSRRLRGPARPAADPGARPEGRSAPHLDGGAGRPVPGARRPGAAHAARARRRLSRDGGVARLPEVAPAAARAAGRRGAVGPGDGRRAAMAAAPARGDAGGGRAPDGAAAARQGHLRRGQPEGVVVVRRADLGREALRPAEGLRRSASGPRTPTPIRSSRCSSSRSRKRPSGWPACWASPSTGRRWRLSCPPASPIRRAGARRWPSTFVAGLQLAKDGQIELRQTERFGPIHLRKRTEQR